jgi:hypothetical protein
MSEPIIIDVRQKFVGAKPRRAAAADSGAIQSANVDSPEMEMAPIPDPDDDIPPDVGAMLIAVVVCAGVWGGIVWAVFRWLVK